MILVLAPQPALERVALVDPFQAGQAPKKPTRVLTFAGGPGLRAARVAHLLGAEVFALSFAGGQLGNLLRENLEKENIAHVLVPTAAPTRGDLLTLDRENGVAHDVPGPVSPVTPDEADRFLSRFSEHLPGANLTILAGNDSGLPLDFWQRAFTLARQNNVPVLADLSGDALDAAKIGGAWLVRVNLHNFQRYAETSLMHDSAIVGEARRLLEQGVQNVVVTLGDEGALLINGTGAWRVKAPVVSHFNPTGAGETLSGALAAYYTRTGDLLESLRYGCAAASVNVTYDAPGYASSGEVGVLFPRTVAGPLVL